MKVLLIEDEKDVREVIEGTLVKEGFEVKTLPDAGEVVPTLSHFRPDIILLDHLLPGKSGVEVLRELRSRVQFRAIPVMMVTGLGSENEKVDAFNDGADDYLTKPFMPRELAARIRAVVRRFKQTGFSEQQTRLISGDLVVDFQAHKVMLRGSEVPLTLTEFKILSELIKQSGQVLTRDRLRERALGNLNVTDRTIDVHMASLRKKLDIRGDDIQTVRGVGYRFAN